MTPLSMVVAAFAFTSSIVQLHARPSNGQTQYDELSASSKDLGTRSPQELITDITQNRRYNKRGDIHIQLPDHAACNLDPEKDPKGTWSKSQAPQYLDSLIAARGPNKRGSIKGLDTLVDKRATGSQQSAVNCALLGPGDNCPVNVKCEKTFLPASMLKQTMSC